MGKLQLLIFSVLILGGLASCKVDEVDPTIATKLANDTDIERYIATQPWSVTPTSTTAASGLYFAVTKPTTSTVIVSPKEGQELEFTYTLSYLSSTVSTSATSSTTTSTTVVTAKVVDTVYATKPVFIPYKKGILKAGLEAGLSLMHEGDQAVLLMPSTLAYGGVLSSDGLVPANSPVRFDVTLNRTRTEDQQLDEYVAANKLSLTSKDTTGLRFVLTTANATAMTVDSALSKGQTVTIRYIATKQLHAKTAVDFIATNATSITSANKANLLTGLASGLKKLRVGETATLLFPSTLGYSDTGLVDKSNATSTSPGVYIVSPFAPLRYDIEVVSAR
jgi:FKBP-type peptidyl-prolyl cis-trans isomerase